MAHVIDKIKRPAKEFIDRFWDIGPVTVYEAFGGKRYVDCASRRV
jgi:hypothetical protein